MNSTSMRKKKADDDGGSGSAAGSTIRSRSGMNESVSVDPLSTSNRGEYDKKGGMHVRITQKRGQYLSYLFNFGIMMTMLFTLIQLFDSTLDKYLSEMTSTWTNEVMLSIDIPDDIAAEQLQEQQQQQQQQPLQQEKEQQQQQQQRHQLQQENVQQQQQEKDVEEEEKDVEEEEKDVEEEEKDVEDVEEEEEEEAQKQPLTSLTGQARLVQLLQDAGIGNLTQQQIENLPKWDDIDKLYGSDVIVYGKDSCEEYQSTIEHKDRVVGVGGMFNTGTNYLDKLLEFNLLGMEHPSLWQIPWGKHRMAYVKENHTAPGMSRVNKDNVLPVIVIRDPYSWMQSMCKAPYAAVWRHKKHHCPNLVPDPDLDTKKRFPHYDVLSKPSFDVSVIFDDNNDALTTHHTSLAHLWSDWYRLYVQVDYPVLIVRYEDLVFYPGKVLQEIADCAGGTVLPQVKLLKSSSKSHGSHTDYTSAIRKTADKDARKNNMTDADYKYAERSLDPILMSFFHYKHPSELVEKDKDDDDDS